jgi:hypothetical protein
VTLDESQAHAIAAGLQTMLWLPLTDHSNASAPHKYARIRKGDQIWVREPFVWFSDSRNPAASGTGYGSLGTARPPRLWREGHTSKCKPSSGSQMPRYQSRLLLTTLFVERRSASLISNDAVLKSGIVATQKKGVNGFAPFIDVGLIDWAPDEYTAFANMWKRAYPRNGMTESALCIGFRTEIIDRNKIA